MSTSKTTSSTFAPPFFCSKPKISVKAKLHKEIDRLNQANQRLQSELNITKQRLHKVNAENIKSTERQEQAQKTAETFENIKANLVSELAAAHKTIRDQKFEMEATKVQNDMYVQRLEKRIHEQDTVITNKNVLLKQEILHLSQKLLEKENECAKLRNKIVKKSVRLLEKRQQLAERAQELLLKNETQLKTQHELENAQKKIAELQHEITKLNGDDILNIPQDNPNVDLSCQETASVPWLNGIIDPRFFPIFTKNT